MMDKQQEIYFDELHADRQDSYETFKKPSMQGVWKSIIEKYSQPAHFVYELLQNADDAEAESARFELYADRLIFAHDGKRRFFVSDPSTEDVDRDAKKLGHINAITSVGLSTKTDSGTIGKFGVGFKSVFSYTNTPEIYDPDVFFKIENYIVPQRLTQDYQGRKQNETLFVFPFNHKTRGAQTAYDDISGMIRSLDYPLLFLTNLCNISFKISDTLGSYKKDPKDELKFDNTSAKFIRLTQNNDESREVPHNDTLWLFSRTYEENHTYSVGFFIDKNEKLMPKKHSAFCFFPTIVDTGLDFIIHAPFLLTDNREGIHAGEPHNIKMISLLSELAANSLAYLRDIGQSKAVPLIDDNIFDIIPHDESAFGDVTSKKAISFKPFYTAIKEAFENQEIIPTLNNGYVAAADAYWGGADNSQLAEVFSNSQLAALTRNEKARWAFVSLSTPRSAGRSVKFDYIRAVVENIVNDNTIIDMLNRSFIEDQEIEWLHTLYKYISLNADRIKRVKAKPIFIDSKGKAAEAYDSKDQAVLFLPLEGGSGFRTINESLIQNNETLKFIEQIGVKEPSLRDEIYNIILPQYKDGVAIATKPDFKKFFQYYLSCPQRTINSFLDLLRGQKFVLCRRKGDETLYRAMPSSVYFPFESLPLWFATKPEVLFVCLDEYIELVGEDNKEELTSFLTDLGVKNMPRINAREIAADKASESKPSSGWEQHYHFYTYRQKWEETYIDGCEEIMVSSEDFFDKTKTIWKVLLDLISAGVLHQSTQRIKYTYWYGNNYSDYQIVESPDLRKLRTIPWLMNKDDKFVSASELTVQTLNTQYDVSNDEALELFRILGIKDDSDDMSDDEANITSFGKQLGLSEDEQRQALLEFARKKKSEASDDDFVFDDDETEDEEDYPTSDEGGDNTPTISKISVKRVGKEIMKRAANTIKNRPAKADDSIGDTSSDEDDYSKPTVDISKIIDKVMAQAGLDIQKAARLEDLKQKAQEAEVYSYGWFNALLELESLNSGENNANSREISISFVKVEREEGTSRIIVLKHPSRYIPQSIEDLADIPLELYCGAQLISKPAIEVVNVKSYTLRVKLRTNADVGDIDLSTITEARIVARNPVFLIEELRKAFIRLGEENGYDDDYDMQGNLCENIEFVFGPPGTGKTTHVARDIILPMMKASQDLKVLVLTPTNKSADVLVRRLMECMGSDHSYLNWLVRFGATNDNTIEQSGVFRDKTFNIRTFPKNVTVTTIARFPYDYFLPDDGTRLHLSALKWDYIIIDEASMIPLASIVYPLFKKTPTKFFIAGDPFQIEPITTVDIWKNENIYTMVKLNSFTKPTTIPHDYHVELLTTQYRSIPEIGEVFSRFAYGGVLKHHRAADSQRPLNISDLFDLKSLNIIKFPVSKYESIYRPKRLQSKTPYQVYSALFAFEFVRYLTSLIEIANTDENFRVGLIAPYRAQADLIDKLMSSADMPKNVDVQVGTIHGFQGDECDIIIALFNPPPKITTHKDMFLNKLNIVNVSISRARDYLIVLMPDDDTENVDNLTLVKKIECLCKEQPTWSEQLSPLIEEIMFGSKTYLEDNSFSTSHQLVNVYGKPEKRYEVRSEDNAVDVQIHE